MPDRALEVEGLSIVVKGSFNPSIFHPQWLLRSNLIRPEEADEAKVDLVHPSVSQFKCAWFAVVVTDDTFQISTQDPTKRMPLRDLAIGTFTILSHSPVKAFGMNHERHFRMLSEDDWHAFGHLYAPKALWSDLVTKPGMQTLSIRGRRPGIEQGELTIKLEPSSRAVPYGVFVHVHEHRNLKIEEKSERPSADSFLNDIAKEWEPFCAYADSVGRRLLENLDNSGRAS